MRPLFEGGVYSRAAFITFSSMTAPRTQLAPRQIASTKQVRKRIFGRETQNNNSQSHMGKIQQVPPRSAAGTLSALPLISRRFVSKRYTRNEDDGEDAFAGCIWRGMTTSSRTQTVFQTV